jgi:hypothetical protein
MKTPRQSFGPLHQSGRRLCLRIQTHCLDQILQRQCRMLFLLLLLLFLLLAHQLTKPQ